MGRNAKLRAKRRELRQYVETRAITPEEANDAMRRAKGRSVDRQGLCVRAANGRCRFTKEKA